MGGTTSALTGAVKTLVEAKEAVGIQDAFWETLIDGTADKGLAYNRGFPDREVLRTVKQECPKNLATLVRRCVLKLQAATRCNLQHTRSMTSPVLSAAQVHVINTVRMLTSIMPIMFEDPAWDGFWSTVTPCGVVVTIPGERILSTETPTAPTSLAVTLIDSLIDLCFVPGFTAPVSKDHPASEYSCVAEVEAQHFIWQAGIARKLDVTPDPIMDQHQGDIMQLLLVCVSKLMYSSAADCKPKEDMWLTHLTSSANPKFKPFYLSVMNTLLSYDAVGWGLPLGSFFPDEDRINLVDACGDFVSLVTDFTPAEGDEQSSTNQFAVWLRQLTNDDELDFITNGMTKLISYPLQYPSQQHPGVHHAVMILLWRLCDTNEIFLQRLLQNASILDLITPVLYYVHHYRLDYGQIGLVHIGIYIILILSGRRNFAVRLNKEYTPAIKIPVFSFEGNYGDLLMLVIHALMTGQNSHLQSLYECFLTIVVNTTPYLKKTSLVAANKLVHLFEVFSSPRFMFACEDNHKLVFFLLEAFNNLIQYQFEGNQHLVYVIIRRRAVFTKLMGLSTSPFVDAAALPSSSIPNADVVFDPALNVPKQKDQNVETPAKIFSSLNKDKAIQEKEHFSVVANQQQQQQPTPFVPTQAWVESWKSKLPLETIQRLLHVLVPQVEKLCSDKGVTDEAEILAFLQNGTLVGLLPVPHPILIRRHQSVPSCTVWFCSYVLGVMYMRWMDPPIWHDTQVRLFRVKTVQ